MVDNADLGRVRAAAEAILDRLGGGVGGIRSVRAVDQAGAPGGELVAVECRDADGSGADCHFALYLPEFEAVAEFASQLQDWVSESDAGWGRPVPPCPGHQHPLSAAVADRVAVWECPRDPAYHREPILPIARM